jgi:hypothetical protein
VYQVELVWNREFNFVPWGSPIASLKDAIAEAEALESSGDGERVKKTRITDMDGNVVWAYGKRVRKTAFEFPEAFSASPRFPVGALKIEEE